MLFRAVVESNLRWGVEKGYFVGTGVLREGSERVQRKNWKMRLTPTNLTTFFAYTAFFFVSSEKSTKKCGGASASTFV